MEEGLKTVLPTIDAWGKVRKEVMLEEHVAEHSDLYGALAEDKKDGGSKARVIVVIPTRTDRAGVPQIFQGDAKDPSATIGKEGAKDSAKNPGKDAGKDGIQ